MRPGEVNMLYLLLVIGAILLILWLLGLTIGFISGPLLWVLLAIGAVMLIVWLFTRIRR